MQFETCVASSSGNFVDYIALMATASTCKYSHWAIEFDRGPEITKEQIRAMHVHALLEMVAFIPPPPDFATKVLPSFSELIRDRKPQS
jgi:hypothetical protein